MEKNIVMFSVGNSVGEIDTLIILLMRFKNNTKFLLSKFLICIKTSKGAYSLTHQFYNLIIYSKEENVRCVRNFTIKCSSEYL